MDLQCLVDYPILSTGKHSNFIRKLKETLKVLHVVWAVFRLPQTTPTGKIVPRFKDLDVRIRRHSPRHQFPHQHPK